jgi:hypothetical protein
MVKPDDIDDLSAQVMARDIAKQVEEERIPCLGFSSAMFTATRDPALRLLGSSINLSWAIFARK